MNPNNMRKIELNVIGNQFGTIKNSEKAVAN